MDTAPHFRMQRGGQMIAAEKLVRAAFRACSIANIPADYARAAEEMLTHEAGHKFDLDRQPEMVRRAGTSLLHAAISHCLMHPPGKPPKTLQWAGHRWYLTIWPSGRVHVSPVQGNGWGVVSGYGDLVE